MPRQLQLLTGIPIRSRCLSVVASRHAREATISNRFLHHYSSLLFGGRHSGCLIWVTTISTCTTTLWCHHQRQRQWTFCDAKQRKPPTFGTSVTRGFHVSSTAAGAAGNADGNNDIPIILRKEERENCPYCEKYSSGPCGSLFQTWLRCTDQHPGKDPNNPQQDWHLSQCGDHAQALAECLEQYQAYYDKPFKQQEETTSSTEEDPKEEDDTSRELQQAWERLIHQELKEIPRAPFPKTHKPAVELRPKDRIAMIMVDMTIHQQKLNSNEALLVVFVEDAVTGQLLSAGSTEDVYPYRQKDGRESGILQTTLPQSTTKIQVSALYEGSTKGENDARDQVIFTSTVQVPPG
ncbi:expressed unknown protein [Seminavis robusta]|uniref:GCK domain-containing protein n=1 Tax=Seminavis robusta TaxID=568900 RepID=A0A9N8HCL1_9STRA|nr:expressed unknown protein [Seminavis robusta]|eukprot:Sro414_g138370.1 n/a (350) ;mRNA; f:57325-58374